MLGWSIATAIVILRTNPELLAERLGPRKGAKSWDIAIMSLLGIIQLVRYIVAGLDQRYGWSGGFPLWTQIAALAVCVLGYALVVWATYSNAFFSQIVRINVERGHTVATGGPYRSVRHPAYAGAILYELAGPILLASWWALLIASSMHPADHGTSSRIKPTDRFDGGDYACQAPSAGTRVWWRRSLADNCCGGNRARLDD
jgi:protein-S-isoprenylcysteine O-methyltransferase Ste14